MVSKPSAWKSTLAVCYCLTPTLTVQYSLSALVCATQAHRFCCSWNSQPSCFEVEFWLVHPKLGCSAHIVSSSHRAALYSVVWTPELFSRFYSLWRVYTHIVFCVCVCYYCYYVQISGLSGWLWFIRKWRATRLMAVVTTGVIHRRHQRPTKTVLRHWGRRLNV